MGADSINLDQLLLDLYAAITEPERLDKVNALIMLATRSRAGAMHYVDLRQRRAWFPTTYGLQPQDILPYEQIIGAENPWMHRQAHLMRPGYIGDSDRYVPKSELKRTRFWSDAMRHLDVCHSSGIVLAADADYTANYTINRSESAGAYGQEELGLLARVAPHWINFFHLHQRLAVAEQFAAACQFLNPGTDTSLLLLDVHGRLLRSNEAAQIQLESETWLRLRNGHVVTARSEDALFLYQAVVKVCYEPQVPLATIRIGASRGGHATLRIHRLPHSSGITVGALPNAILTLDPPRMPIDEVQLLQRLRIDHQLAPAEARLAQALHSKLKLSSAAASLGISLGNARTTLKHVLAKTRSPNQQALVLLVERLLHR